jgi:hypothetical protein
MNSGRFDRLTRAIGRRGLLAGAFALAAGSLPPPDPVFAGKTPTGCPKRGVGARCRKDGQCCSGRCAKKQGKRRGKCRCSRLGRPCAENRDCCGHQEDGLGGPICQDKPTGFFRCELPE